MVSCLIPYLAEELVAELEVAELKVAEVGFV